MQYLIYSNYWTENDKQDMYWGPNNSGYTPIIAEAGVYSEEDKQKREKSLSDRSTYVPLTEELIQKAYEQLKEIDHNIHNMRTEATRRYNGDLKYCKEQEDRNENRYNALDRFSKL